MDSNKQSEQFQKIKDQFPEYDIDLVRYISPEEFTPYYKVVIDGEPTNIRYDLEYTMDLAFSIICGERDINPLDTKSLFLPIDHKTVETAVNELTTALIDAISEWLKNNKS